MGAKMGIDCPDLNRVMNFGTGSGYPVGQFLLQITTRGVQRHPRVTQHASQKELRWGAKFKFGQLILRKIIKLLPPDVIF